CSPSWSRGWVRRSSSSPPGSTRTVAAGAAAAAAGGMWSTTSTCAPWCAPRRSGTRSRSVSSRGPTTPWRSCVGPLRSRGSRCSAGPVGSCRRRAVRSPRTSPRCGDGGRGGG
ncbi:MAG: hypothetical protein AVDCRST_MAG66-3768, partial [uncultured Pseudonocardia sp.]